MRTWSERGGIKQRAGLEPARVGWAMSTSPVIPGAADTTCGPNPVAVPDVGGIPMIDVDGKTNNPFR